MITFSGPTAKLPILKWVEYEMWDIRIKQYFQIQDYALLEMIENGDSWDLVSQTSQENGITVTKMSTPATIEEKINKKNDIIFFLAIKNRFGGNKESKKMQKTILKQNYEKFAASSQEGLDKTYDMFQKLINQLEMHGEVISQEDANMKFLRSKLCSSSNSQNVAFVSSDNSSSTNETFNTAHSNSTASSKDQASTASYADDVMFSFFSNQSNAPRLDYEDLEQIDADDLEEMDLKLQVAMLTRRVKRFIKKTGRKMDLNDKESVGFDRTKVECYNCHMRGHFSRECRVVNTGAFQAEEGITNFALMAYTSQGSSSSSSSDSEVHTCSKDCLKSYETLQKQYDQQREALNKSNLEIIGYQMGLESLEARIVVHEKNEAVYEEDIAFLKYDVQVKDISIKELKNQLENALKEKDDLKLKLEKFETSSKNLSKLINSQISVKDKIGLGYDSQMNESEVVHNVFNSRESDVDDSLVNDRFKTGKGFHVSAIRKTTTSVPETETSISKTSKDIVEKPKTVRPSAPIIEEWDTDSDNDTVATKSGQVPVNAAKQSSPRATVSISTARPVNTATPKPKVNDALPTTYSYFKSHSPVRRVFNQKSTTKTNNFNEKVNTARVNNVTTARPKAVVGAAEGNRENVVKSSACWIWRPT
ncbi:ribonuclease H-like domain-containing protein [Tanacetum coccineum]